MLNDMMQKQGLTRSYALSLLRSKFESEEQHQEVEYVEDLIRKEAKKQEQEFELPPTRTTATSTAAEEVVTTNQPGATIPTSTNEASKISYPPQQQKQETLSSKSISKQLDKQTIQINNKSKAVTADKAASIPAKTAAKASFTNPKNSKRREEV